MEWTCSCGASAIASDAFLIETAGWKVVEGATVICPPCTNGKRGSFWWAPEEQTRDELKLAAGRRIKQGAS